MFFVDIAAGMLMGTLSGMGVGGGGLLVIYLTMLRGTGQVSAQGINLYFFIFASAAALFVHSTKRKINWKVVLVCSMSGMISAFFGSAAAAAANPYVLKKLFGCMLIATGTISLVKGYLSHRSSVKKRSSGQITK